MPPCAYGTRLKPSILTSWEWVTGQMLASAAQWLRPFVTEALIESIFPRAIDLEELCSQPPPQLPDIDLVDLALRNQLNYLPQVVIDWLFTRWAQVNWNTYCECIPAPTPTPATCASGSSTMTDSLGGLRVIQDVDATSTNLVGARITLQTRTGDSQAGVFAKFYRGTYLGLSPGDVAPSFLPGTYSDFGSDLLTTPTPWQSFCPYGQPAAGTHILFYARFFTTGTVTGIVECDTSGLCEPEPYVTPPSPPTPDLPPPPDVTPTSCTLDDVCAQLTVLQQLAFSLRYSVTQLQRYRLPFAYKYGASHSGLTGESSFPADGLLGLLVEVTAFPPDRPQLMGHPDYVWDLGWLSAIAPDGLTEEKRLSQLAFVWIPRTMPTASAFGYSLFDGVTITITELMPED